MSLPNRAGVFHARVIDSGFGETGPNNLATVTAKYAIYEDALTGADVSAEGMEITGFHYVEKKDGTLNEGAVKSLKAAFGWDGLDPCWFETPDACQKPVQITVGMEEYKGKTSPKVQWLNPYGSTGGGGIVHADEAQASALKNRLGSKLRALSGGAAAAKPPAAKAPKGRPTAPTAAAATATADDAWEVFAAAKGASEAEWNRILAEMFPGKAQSAYTPADWGRVKVEAAAKILPI
jgi:hypothetical protein